MRQLWTSGLLAAGVVLGGAVGFAAEGRNGVPDVVRQAVTGQFPNARIAEVEAESHTIRVYEVEVEVDGQERELLVTEDGVVLESSSEVSRDQLPDAVREALRNLSRRARVTEVEEVDVMAQWQATPLESPRREYEVEVRLNGREQEIRLTADGRLAGLGGDDDGGDDDDDDDDDREDEDDD